MITPILRYIFKRSRFSFINDKQLISSSSIFPRRTVGPTVVVSVSKEDGCAGLQGGWLCQQQSCPFPCKVGGPTLVISVSKEEDWADSSHVDFHVGWGWAI